MPDVPRHIKVNGHRIHLRLVQQLIWSFAAATAGAYIISALYYLITQVHWTSGGHTVLYLKPGWDGLFKTAWWPLARHDLRDVYEGVLATLLVKSLMANWKRKNLDEVGAFRLITAPLLIIVAALPIVIVGIWVVNFAGPWVWHHTVGHRVVHLAVHLPSWLDTYLSTWNWQPLIIGIIAGLVVHRLYRPIGNTVQLYFIERAVNRARSYGIHSRVGAVPADAAGGAGTVRLDDGERYPGRETRRLGQDHYSGNDRHLCFAGPLRRVHPPVVSQTRHPRKPFLS